MIPDFSLLLLLLTTTTAVVCTNSRRQNCSQICPTFALSSPSDVFQCLQAGKETVQDSLLESKSITCFSTGNNHNRETGFCSLSLSLPSHFMLSGPFVPNNNIVSNKTLASTAASASVVLWRKRREFSFSMNQSIPPPVVKLYRFIPSWWHSYGTHMESERLWVCTETLQTRKVGAKTHFSSDLIFPTPNFFLSNTKSLLVPFTMSQSRSPARRKIGLSFAFSHTQTHRRITQCKLTVDKLVDRAKKKDCRKTSSCLSGDDRRIDDDGSKDFHLKILCLVAVSWFFPNGLSVSFSLLVQQQL